MMARNATEDSRPTRKKPTMTDLGRTLGVVDIGRMPLFRRQSARGQAPSTGRTRRWRFLGRLCRIRGMFPAAVTIFLGAFLLFQVHPLIGKYILPWFGGGPGVWTTCMLFFQIELLGGYAYAHCTSQRLKPRAQAALHVALLIAGLGLLPITPSDSWKQIGRAH